MTTPRDAMNAILADYQIKGQSTVARVEQCFVHLFAHFGETSDLAAIGYSALLGYARARLDAGAAPSTVRNEFIVLRRGFNLLECAGEIRTPKFPTIKLNNTRKGFFEDHQFTEVHKKLPEDFKPWAQFLYLTGWRAGEALSLTWNGSVDFVGGVVRLQPGETKNRDGRTFPFSALPELRELLVDQLARTKSLETILGRVVPTVFWRASSGGPIVNYRDYWVVAVNEAGYPGLIPHDLRRTAVRNLERAGVPRSVAMRLTGHRTESIYNRYAITNEADLAEGVRKLSEYRRGWKSRKDNA